jgi:hypothetical protein
MQTDMDQTIYMQIDGIIIDLPININPNLSYKEQGKTVIYMQIKIALNGMITVTFVLKDLSTMLVFNWRLKWKQYDWCIDQWKTVHHSVACG